MCFNIGSNSPKVFPILRESSPIKVKFEVQFEISEDEFQFPYSPNIDVAVKDSQSIVFTVESKFTEPYSNRKHEGFKQKYIDNFPLNIDAKEDSYSNDELKHQ